MAGTKHPQPRELAALHQLLLNADDNDEQAELQFKTWPQPTATAPSAAVAQLPAARCAASQRCDGAFPPQGTRSPPHPAWTPLPDRLGMNPAQHEELQLSLLHPHTEPLSASVSLPTPQLGHWEAVLGSGQRFPDKHVEKGTTTIATNQQTLFLPRFLCKQ